MKTKNLRIAAILLMMTAFFHSCNKNYENEVPTLYLGTWKLMSVNLYGISASGHPFTAPIVHFSDADAIYEFKKDGIMTVSEKTAYLDLDWYAEHGFLDLFLEHKIGVGLHQYSATSPWYNGWCWWSLKVGDKGYGLFVSENKSLMNIIMVVLLEDWPTINTTKTSPVERPSLRFEFYLENVDVSM